MLDILASQTPGTYTDLQRAMTNGSITRLKEIAARCPPVFFQPVAVFVAYCGVLTVVFEGFDACVLALKDEIDRTFDDLDEEHEGSMWPKVSLAVLKESERLTPTEVRRLRDMADDLDEIIRAQADPIKVDHLLAVRYGCRSLEVRQRTVDLPLLAEPASIVPPPHHTRFVRSVVSQFSRERLEEYLASIDREGHRETHYREPATGWSLIADVEIGQLPFAHAVLETVEQIVPGKYAAFDPNSWHVTIRTLDQAPREQTERDLRVA